MNSSDNKYSKTKENSVQHIELEDTSIDHVKVDEMNLRENMPAKRIREEDKDDDGLESLEDDQFNEYGEKNFCDIPKKTIILPIFLLLIGVSFIIAGLVSYSNNDENQKIASFLVFGSILSIPGFYYSFQLVQAYRAETLEEREEILEEIPV